MPQNTTGKSGRKRRNRKKGKGPAPLSPLPRAAAADVTNVATVAAPPAPMAPPAPAAPPRLPAAFPEPAPAPAAPASPLDDSSLRGPPMAPPAPMSPASDASDVERHVLALMSPDQAPATPSEASPASLATTEPASPPMPEDEPAPPSAADVVLGPEIGRGKFARVVRATHGGRVVAAKLPVRNEDDDREEAEVARYLAQEIRMLRGCDHEHVVRFVGVVDGTTLLTELCAGGDLLRLLEGNAELGWPLRLRLAGDACRGLAYLHERGVMHRDVKAENVLLSQDWRGKLCDFGMARDADENSQCKTLCGTPEYMAPELLLGEVEAYGLAADVFSLGCVLVELATREACATCLVREARNMFEVDDDILRAKLAGAPDSFVELAVQCLAGEDYERPLAEDAQAWLEELASEAGAVAAPPAPAGVAPPPPPPAEPPAPAPPTAWGALGLDAGRVSGELLLMDAAGRFARRWVVVAGSCVSWTGEAARDAGARDLRAATAVAVEGDDVVLDGTTRFRAADALRRDVWAAALRAAVARAPAGGPGDVAVAVAPLPRFPGYVDVRARRGGLRASRFVAVEAVTTDLDARLGALAEDDAALPRPPAGGGADAAAVEAYLAEVAAAVGGRPRLLEALLEALDLADDGPHVVVGAARPV